MNALSNESETLFSLKCFECKAIKPLLLSWSRVVDDVSRETNKQKYRKFVSAAVRKSSQPCYVNYPSSIWCSLFTAVLFLCNYFLLSFCFSGINWFCIGVALRLTQNSSSNLININAWFKARIRQTIVCYCLSSTRQSLWIACLDDISVKQNNIHKVVTKNLLDQNCYSKPIILEINFICKGFLKQFTVKVRAKVNDRRFDRSSVILKYMMKVKINI